MLILTSQCWQIQLFMALWQKQCPAQNLRQNGEISSMWYRTEIDSMYCLFTYVPEKCL